MRSHIATTGPTVTLTMSGLESEGGHLRLTSFVQELQSLRSTLFDYEALVSGGVRASYFRIIELSHASPATVVIEAAQERDRPDLRSRTVDGFFSVIDRIDEGEVPEELSAPMLRRIRELSRSVGKQVGAASIAVGGQSVDLTDRFTANVDKALANVDRSYGIVEGRLEQINVHSGANRFRIYSEFEPKTVECRFPQSLKRQAISGIDSSVRITGVLKYLPRSDFPHEIEVEEIEILEPDDELPGLSDLRGIAPDATGDLSSEDFIRRQRDGWNR